MNKKILVSVGVIGLLLFVGTISCADGVEEALETYLNNPKFDLLGRNYDKILFIGDYSIKEDIKTLPLQLKSMIKIFDQNKYIYGSLGGAAGLKAVMGEKAFGELLFKILKVIVK